jgi:hypothetical protein
MAIASLLSSRRVFLVPLLSILSVLEHPARLTMTIKISENFLTPTLSPKTSICIDTGVFSALPG